MYQVWKNEKLIYESNHLELAKMIRQICGGIVMFSSSLTKFQIA